MTLRRQHFPETWTDEQKKQESNVPDWLLRMIARCLEKKSAQRFPNGMALHEYIARHSIATTDRDESVPNQIQALRQENQQLVREREELRRLLVEMKEAEKARPKTFETLPKSRSSSGGTILALILTAAVIGLIVFFALKSNGEKNRETNPSSQNSGNQPVKPRQPIGQFKVLAARAYFHNEPDSSTRRSAYLIPSNDVVAGLEEKNGFIYTEFTNSRGQTSKGWVRRQDLVPLEDWSDSAGQEPEARPVQQDINNQLLEAKELLANNKVKEAVYIYSYLARQDVAEAMYQYANLALLRQHDELDCGEALVMMEKASEAGYPAAKRTLGFLFIFAENQDVLSASQYEQCTYEKDVFKGTQLLIQAIRGGDSTAREILDEINLRRQTNNP
jgi:eukaryotic-like serine/threonine-protein kinase